MRNAYFLTFCNRGSQPGFVSVLRNIGLPVVMKTTVRPISPPHRFNLEIYAFSRTMPMYGGSAP